MLWVTPVVSQATVIQEIDTERIIEVVNEARDDAGMSMLEWSDILAQTASHFAEQIVDDRVSPRQLSSDDVEEYLIEADFRVSNANFASWTDAAEIETLVQSIVTRWRQLILFDSYSHLGIGRVEVDDGEYYYMVIIATANRCDHAAQEDDAQVQLEQAEDILRAVNDARADEGLNALLLDTDLIYAAARWYSDDMREYGYPTNRPGGRAHIGTDGSDPYERVTREGYAATTTRENILARWNLSAAGAFDQWWNSPPHHDNMLSDDIEYMALAFTCNVDTGEYYYTQLFATPVVIESEDARRDDLIALITAARRAAGLAPLRTNTALTSVAQETSVYYQQQENFPNTVWDDVRAVYRFDDIEAFSFTADFTSEQVVAYWLEHRERDLLLSRSLTDIGIGITFDAEQMIYVYIVFIAQPN